MVNTFSFILSKYHCLLEYFLPTNPPSNLEMPESQPDDALDLLIKTVETMETVETVQTVETVETVETKETVGR